MLKNARPGAEYYHREAAGKGKRPLYRRLVGRLGRNYTEILEQWSFKTKGRGAAIVVLDMSLLDTCQGRDLAGTLIADIVLQLLSYVARTEMENIHQRQAEGIAAAKGRDALRSAAAEAARWI